MRLALVILLASLALPAVAADQAAINDLARRYNAVVNQMAAIPPIMEDVGASLKLVAGQCQEDSGKLNYWIAYARGADAKLAELKGHAP